MVKLKQLELPTASLAHVIELKAKVEWAPKGINFLAVTGSLAELTCTSDTFIFALVLQALAPEISDPVAK